MDAEPIAEIGLRAGRVAMLAMPGGAGDLDGDLERIAKWRAGIVLSLALPDELGRSAPDLTARLDRLGIDHALFPVPDFGIPEGGADKAWPALGRRLARFLDAGGRLAVHCRAGCGRSGMVVLRLMVEAGEPQGTALTRLRASRPCAVETEEQALWATAAVCR